MTRDSHRRSPSASLVFIIGLVVLLLFGWVAFPALLYQHKKQPLDFNHKLHAKLADYGCESCHAFREDGSFTGIPGIETCSRCHQKRETGGLAEQILIRDYIDRKADIPWHVYSRQPDNVFFSHAPHVKSAGLPCEECHGDVGANETMKPYQENRITRYSRAIWGETIVMSDGMRMDDCVQCHQKNKPGGASVQTHKEGCFVCHQ